MNILTFKKIVAFCALLLTLIGCANTDTNSCIQKSIIEGEIETTNTCRTSHHFWLYIPSSPLRDSLDNLDYIDIYGLNTKPIRYNPLDDYYSFEKHHKDSVSLYAMPIDFWLIIEDYQNRDSIFREIKQNLQIVLSLNHKEYRLKNCE